MTIFTNMMFSILNNVVGTGIWVLGAIQIVHRKGWGTLSISILVLCSIFIMIIIIKWSLSSHQNLVHCCYYISLLFGWWNITNQNQDILQLILIGTMAHLAVKFHHVDFQATFENIKTYEDDDNDENGFYLRGTWGGRNHHSVPKCQLGFLNPSRASEMEFEWFYLMKLELTSRRLTVSHPGDGAGAGDGPPVGSQRNATWLKVKPALQQPPSL